MNKQLNLVKKASSDLVNIIKAPGYKGWNLLPELKEFKECKNSFQGLFEFYGKETQNPHDFSFEIQEKDLMCFPMSFQKGTGYQLHDHPEMVVFTLVLKGNLQVVSFEKIEDLEDNKCRLKVDSIDTFREGEVAFLHHHYKNLHSIGFPQEDGVVLDLSVNYYDQKDRTFGLYFETEEPGIYERKVDN